MFAAGHSNAAVRRALDALFQFDVAACCCLSCCRSVLCCLAQPAACPACYMPCFNFMSLPVLLQVRVMLPGAACLSRRKALLVELPPCFDVMGDSGAIGRVVCSRAAAPAGGAGDAAYGLAGSAEEPAAAGVGSSARATIASWALVSKRASKSASKAAAADGVAEDTDDEGASSDSDSDGGFARQLQALLQGRKKQAAAAAQKCDSDDGSGSEKSDSGMSDGDESADEEADEADVTAVCLDLKGRCSNTLWTAGTDTNIGRKFCWQLQRGGVAVHSCVSMMSTTTNADAGLYCCCCCCCCCRHGVLHADASPGRHSSSCAHQHARWGARTGC
jgi:hypothetical protein